MIQANNNLFWRLLAPLELNWRRRRETCNAWICRALLLVLLGDVVVVVVVIVVCLFVGIPRIGLGEI